MKEWRPNNWEQISFHLGFNTPYSANSVELSIYSSGVEAGGKAMLEALEKMAEESPTGTFTIDSRIIRM